MRRPRKLGMRKRLMFSLFVNNIIYSENAVFCEERIGKPESRLTLSSHMKRCLSFSERVGPRIGHVRYINIPTWLRGFQVKLLYLVLFSLYPSLFWELRDKRNLKNLQF